MKHFKWLPDEKRAATWVGIALLAAIYFELHAIGGSRICDLMVVSAIGYWWVAMAVGCYQDDWARR